MEAMQTHCEWDIPEYPCQDRVIIEVVGWEDPVLGSDDLSQGLDFVGQCWDDLCCGTF